MNKIGSLFAAIVFLLVLTPMLALAQDTGVISKSSWGYGLWEAMSQILIIVGTPIATFVGGWIAVKVSTLLSKNDEVARLKIEGELRNALHAAALNGLKYAMTRAGIPSGATPTATVIAEAIDYIRTKSPDTAKQAGASDVDLEQIILSKFPDVIGMIKNSNAKPTSRSGG